MVYPKKIFLSRRLSFTLLEIVLCVSIVSVGLVAVVGAFSLVAKTDAAAANYTKAFFLIQEKASDIEREGLENYQSKGQFPKPFEGFSWILAKGPVVLGKTSSFTLSVYWKEQQNEKNITLTTFIRDKKP